MTPTAAVLLVSAIVLAGLGVIAAVVSFLKDPHRPRSLRQWLRTWWLEVPEPRELSVIYCAVYLVAGLTGLSMIIAPPDAIEHVASAPIVAGVGLFFMLGALAAGLGGVRENWRLERLGLVLLAGALAGDAVLVAALQVDTLGTRLAGLGVTILAVSVFVVRWLLIRGYSYRPRG